ncbi:MAG: serine/threonine-protein kinase [Verrucomicrobiota bacterium]
MPATEDIKIQDYQIHFPPLGQGAFGKVFRATYRGISDRAVKIFKPGAIDLANISRELEKLSKVTEHHGIVTLHEFDLLHDPPYYTMGLHADASPDGSWETRTLEKLCGNVDHREGWRLTREIADALAYLHLNQIIHCDIKPSNILLSDEIPHRIKICDFGQSRGQAAEGFRPVGTPLYASPEQLRDPRDSSHGKGFRWDVYSFGIVAYKLFTGRLPRLQEMAEAEEATLDLEATLDETSLEATMAEGSGVNSAQLATLTEAVEEINWPSDIYVPTIRKNLIEECLSLDPNKRPADMREVWERIKQIDQQSVVKKARRLNTIFATLLVVAIWASGFAFIQAQKAKRATEQALQAREETEQSARAAEELMVLFVTEVGKGDISGAGADRLYSIVAENATTFLESRAEGSRETDRILRFSAQTASIKGRQAMDTERYADAIQHYTSSYEIRAQLASEAEGERPRELSLLASRDLMEIGRAHELSGTFSEALSFYDEALELRKASVEGLDSVNLRELRDISAPYQATARVHYLLESPDRAAETVDTAIDFIAELPMEPQASPASQLIELIRLADLKGSILYQSGDFEAASDAYTALIDRYRTAEDITPTMKSELDTFYLTAVNTLGRIQIKDGEFAAARELFREEIEMREREMRRKPYDPDVKIELSRAYALAAASLDVEQPASRSLAVYYLEEGIEMIAGLPPEYRNREDVQDDIIGYNQQLSEIFEMDE